MSVARGTVRSRSIERIGAALVLAAVAACSKGLSLQPGGRTPDAAAPDAAANPPDAASFGSSPTIRSEPIGTTGRQCKAIGSGSLRALALSPDGALLAVARGDGSVELRATSDGGLVRTLDGDDRVPLAIHLLSGGLLAIASTPGLLTIRNVDGGPARVLLSNSSGYVTDLLASPDRKVVVAVDVTDGGKLLGWTLDGDAPAWVTRASGEMPTSSHSGRAYPLHDGVAIRRDDGKVTVVRWSDGAEGRTLFECTNHMTEDPPLRGRTVAARLVAVRRPGVPVRLPTPTALSPDGALAFYAVPVARATSSPDVTDATEIAAVRVADGSLSWSLLLDAYPGVFDVPRHAFSSDGTRIALAFPALLLVLETATGATVTRELITDTRQASFDASGALWLGRQTVTAASSAGEVLRLDLEARTVRTVATTGPGASGAVERLDLSPDGQLVAVSTRGSGTTGVRVFGLDDGRPRFALGGASLGVFSADSTSMAVDNGTHLSLVRASDGELIRHFSGGCGARDLSFAGRDALVAVCRKGITRFRIADGAADLDIADGQWESSALATSRDGTRVAAVQRWSATNEWGVWELPSGRRRAGGTEASAQVESVAFSPDGSTFVRSLSHPFSYSELLVHDAATGRLRQRVLGSHGGGLRFSRTGALLAVSGFQTTVILRVADWGWMPLGPRAGPSQFGWWGVPPGFDGDDRVVVPDPGGVVRVFCDVGPAEPFP